MEPNNSPLKDFLQEPWSLPDSWTLPQRPSEVLKPGRQGKSVCQGRGVSTQGCFLFLWGRMAGAWGEVEKIPRGYIVNTYPVHQCLALRQGYCCLASLPKQAC